MMVINNYVTQATSGDAAIAALGLTAWWDPSDLSTVFTDAAGTTPASVGNGVARINDKSGNGNHLINSTGANRPTLGQSGSLYYLAFSNTGTWLDCAGITMTQPNDWVIGAYYLDVGTFRFVFDGNTGTTRQALITQSSIPRLYAGSAVVTAGSVSASTAYVHTCRFDGASSFIRTNGVQTTTSATPGTQGVSGIRFGAANNATSPMSGRIFGALCRDATFSAGEITTVESYMAGKVGASF